MNYIWDLVIKAKKRGIEQHDITFAPAEQFSPYMELALDEINMTELSGEFEAQINPYYRFEPIFRHLVPIQDDLPQARRAFFDMLAHLVVRTDLRRGLGRHDYERLFLEREILFGAYGDEVESAFRQIDPKRRLLLLNHLLGVHRTGPCVELLRSLVRQAYENGIVYQANDERNLLMVYLGVYKSDQEEAMARLMESLFIPLQFTVEWYYEYHFGIIDVPQVMGIDTMMIC